MKKFKVFFFIFFVLIFPLLLEITNLDNRNMEIVMQRKADNVIAYLILGGILWVLVFYYYFSKNIYSLIIYKTRLKRILRDGIQRSAEIVSKKVLSLGNGSTAMKLKLSLENFHHHPIEIDYCFVPSNKQLNSFKKGEVVSIYIDRKLRPPYFCIESTSYGVSLRNIGNRVFILLLLITYAVLLFVGSFYFQSKGMGWRFLHFFHPWILVPLLCFLAFKLYAYLNRDFLLAKELENKQNKVLFSGKPANAQVIKAIQTDKYIFEDALVKYEVKFPTFLNEWCETSILKTVAVNQLYNIEHSPRKILYVPENPAQAVFIDKVS